MAIGLASIAGMMGAVVAMEGIMAIIEHIEGDPEADVQAALQALAAKNQRRAFALEATEQLGREDLQERFAQFNVIPQQALSQAAIVGSAPLSVQAGLPPDTGLLDFVTARLRVTPDQLRAVSAPNRMGDMSGALRAAGRTPPR